MFYPSPPSVRRGATATSATTEAALKFLDGKVAAVNFPDNSHGRGDLLGGAAVTAINWAPNRFLQNGHPRPEPHRPSVRFAGAASLGIKKRALPCPAIIRCWIGCPEIRQRF